MTGSEIPKGGWLAEGRTTSVVSCFFFKNQPNCRTAAPFLLKITVILRSKSSTFKLGKRTLFRCSFVTDWHEIFGTVLNSKPPWGYIRLWRKLLHNKSTNTFQTHRRKLLPKSNSHDFSMNNDYLPSSCIRCYFFIIFSSMHKYSQVSIWIIQLFKGF